MFHCKSVLASMAALVVASFFPGSASNVRAAEDDFLVNTRDGVVSDVSLLKLVPESGEVSGKEEFAKLWQGWNVGKEVPSIDFDKQRVFVFTEKGTKHQVGDFLSNKGVFSFVIIRGLKGQDVKTTPIDGFHYQIAVVRGDPVKSFSQTPLFVDPPADK